MGLLLMLFSKQRLQTLLEQDLVDPWGVDEEGRLHVRLNVQRWSKLQYMFPECRVAIHNVEEYVRKGEREMFNNTRLGATTLGRIKEGKVGNGP